MASQIPLPASVQFAPDYPIVTERLLLRPFRRGDVDAVFSYRSREDVAQYLFDRPMNHDEFLTELSGQASGVAAAGRGYSA